MKTPNAEANKIVSIKMVWKVTLWLLPIAMSEFTPLASAWEEEQSKEYQISPWGVPDQWSPGYPQLDCVKPGDIVSFHWTDGGYSDSSDYNVYLYPTESCTDETGKELIGSTSGASYEIKEWDQGRTLHFACDTDDYCERGMSIVIIVSAGEVPTPTGSSWEASPTPWPTEWVAPTDPPTKSPTSWPTEAYTPDPTYSTPTPWPTEWVAPTDPPTKSPTSWPTEAYTSAPTYNPTNYPTVTPTNYQYPTAAPTYEDTPLPTDGATSPPTEQLTEDDVVAGPEPKEILIDYWEIPEDTQPYPPIEANVGDTIKWVINPGHDVWYHPSLTCDRTGSIFIGDATNGGSYTFQAVEGSVEGTQHLFACQVGSHCDLGMHLLVTVFAQPETVPSTPVQEEEGTDQSQEPGEGDVQQEEPPAGENLNLEWEIPADTQPFAPVDMIVGDSITFTMGPGHNVFIHPSGSCDQTDSIFVGDETVTYTFDAEDGSPSGKLMFFACDIGSHCDLGMQIAVNVFTSSDSFSSSQNSPSLQEADRVSGREILIDWKIPEDNQAFEPIEAVVGDTLLFSWQGEDQNVFIHPTMTCDETRSIFVGLSNPTAYTFQATDGSPDGTDHLFVSDVGSNCELGMQQLVKVFSASDVTTDETNNAVASTSTNPTSSAPAKALAAFIVTLISIMASSVFLL
jgi:plastocyanin